MAISWQYSSVKDLEWGLLSFPDRIGGELVGRDAALSVWRGFLGQPAFIAATLTAQPPFKGHTSVGLGASVFVKASFMASELSNPQPYLNARIIASVHACRSVLLTREDIAAANAGAGVDVVILCGGFIEPAHLDFEVQTISASSFVESHAGYRLNRVAMETSTPFDTCLARSTGMYDDVAAFPERGRVLHAVSRDKAESLVASVARVAFLHRDPRLRLREADQELLVTALRGATDEQLAARLGLSVSAVKARWRSAFQRISDTLPELVDDAPSSGTQADVSARGAQKRHRVLAYVREHPEELRPFDWSALGRRRF